MSLKCCAICTAKFRSTVSFENAISGGFLLAAGVGDGLELKAAELGSGWRAERQIKRTFKVLRYYESLCLVTAAVL
jgi:hypothetical protein